MAIEILAPAGGQPQLIAAVRSGADAVYLGTKGFNARRGAANFDAEELASAVSYCHARGVKVHVAANTLVTDAELPALVESLRQIAAAGADAVIVQDLAVAALLRRHCPDLALHASTQMAIHNAAGATAAAELGFSRVVLARELTLEEIRRIHDSTPLELEAFVHGALCMCVSGRCYLSAMLGGRSGNRGMCAQPCRLDYRSGARDHALSLKDMCHIPHLRALADVGVTSLKIEGRLKRPEYVSAAVLACRTARAGGTPDLARLQAVFSRSGFTDGYLTGRRDLDMFGYRTAEDAAASAAVLGALADGYRRELSSVPVDMALDLCAGAPSELRVTDGEHTVSVQGPVPEPAKTRGLDTAAVRKSLEKTGGTPFYLHTLSMPESVLPAGNELYLAPSALNALRREALDRLLELRARVEPKAFTGTPVLCASGAVRPKTGKEKLYLRFQSREQLFDGTETADRAIFPLEVLDAGLLRQWGEKLVGELPALCYPGQEEALAHRLAALHAAGLKWVLAEDLGLVHMARALGFRVLGGARLNILNSLSLARHAEAGLDEATLSFELAARYAERLDGGPVARGLLAYGYLPLMLFRACPARGKTGCGACDGKPKLTDRRGTALQLLCDRRQYTTLLNPVPLYVADTPPRGLDFLTLYFTTESAARCRDVYTLARAGLPLDVERTRGLYYRELK